MKAKWNGKYYNAIVTKSDVSRGLLKVRFVNSGTEGTVKFKDICDRKLHDRVRSAERMTRQLQVECCGLRERLSLQPATADPDAMYGVQEVTPATQRVQAARSRLLDVRAQLATKQEEIDLFVDAFTAQQDTNAFTALFHDRQQSRIAELEAALRAAGANVPPAGV